MRGGGLLEMVPFVYDQPRVGWNHRRLVPVLLYAPHREVGHQQMVVDDNDVGLRGDSTCPKHEAGVVVGTALAQAQIGLGRDFVPHIRARHRRARVRQRSVVGPLRPVRQGCHFPFRCRVEQRAVRRSRVVEARETEIVPPALEQCEADRLVGQRRGEERQVLADELFLKIYRIGGDDRAFAIHGRPSQRGDKVGKRLADARAGLEQSDAASLVEARHRGGHGALTGAILISDVRNVGERRSHCTVRAEVGGDRLRFGACGIENGCVVGITRIRLRPSRRRVIDAVSGHPPVWRKGDHVLSGFFFAAGKSTLLRISRYPGEFGCNARSVDGLPTACCGSSGSWPPRKVHEPLP